MVVQFSCPRCDKLFNAPDTARGKSPKCPICGGALLEVTKNQDPAASGPIPPPAPVPRAPSRSNTALPPHPPPLLLRVCLDDDKPAQQPLEQSSEAARGWWGATVACIAVRWTATSQWLAARRQRRREWLRQQREAQAARDAEFRRTHQPCPACGQWIPKDSPWCPACQAPFRDPAALQTWYLRKQLESMHEQMASDRRNRRGNTQCTGCLLILVALAIGIVFPPLGALILLLGIVVLIVGFCI